jgi:peptide/nickel transport system substrate-binding protein
VKKFLVALATVGVVAASVTGCAPASSVIPNTVLNVGQSALATNLNSAVSDSATAVAANQYIHELTSSGFYNLSSNGQLVANTKFGTAKIAKSGSSNFTVAYTLSPDVKWGDGQPITAADLLVSWAAATNFGGADFNSSLRATGLSAASKIPTISSDGLTFTATFDHAVPDWQTAVQLSVPAHLLAKNAFGLADAAKAIKRFERAVNSTDKADLDAVASTFKKAFALSANSLSEALFFSSGAYDLKSATNTEVVLVAKKSCTWCKSAKVETVNLKFYQDPSALDSAVKAGDVDLAEAVDTTSLPLVTLIDDVKAATGYKYTSAQSGKIEALIINYGKKSYFASKLVKDANSKASRMRDALLQLMPRQRLLDALSIPIKLTRSDSFVYLSTQAQYEADVQQNGSSKFRIQDAEKATELNAKYNHDRSDLVKVLFDANNYRESIAFNLLNAYATSSRTPVVNSSTPDVAAAIARGKYDAYFGQVDVLSSGLSALGAMQSASTTLKNNDVDSILAKIATKPQGSNQTTLLAALDKNLFANGYGVPLYEIPKVIIFGPHFTTYSAPVGANNAVSNFETWNVPAQTKK